MRNNEGLIGTETIYLAAALLAGTVLYEAGTHKTINPEGTYTVISADKDDVILEQNGKQYTIKTEDMSEEVKASLIKTRPDLEAFLTNGPINIVK